MEYRSASEAARAWGVSQRQVQRLLAAGRVAGAKKYGRAWMLPANAPKPRDPRREATPFFTLPAACPDLLFTTLYARPGEGDAIAASITDAEAQALFLAQLAYYRCDYKLASRLAGALYAKTARTDVKAGCSFVLCLSAMYDGCVPRFQKARAHLASLPCDTADAEAVRGFTLTLLKSALYDKEDFPDWLREGCFDPLPADCYPMARMLFLKWLLIEKGDPGLSVICGPLISQSRLEGAVLSEIYCRLFAAVGFHDRGEYEPAARQLDAAIALALPDGLLAPLVENRSQLGLLLDERLSAADKAAAAAVRALSKRLLSGWTTLCEAVRGVSYSTPRLTAREYHAAKLASKGLTNAEIAARMRLSVNSVKRYLSDALAKTGASDRASLAAFIVPDGVTLP